MRDLSDWYDDEDGHQPDTLLACMGQGLCLSTSDVAVRRSKLAKALLTDVGKAAVNAFEIADNCDSQTSEQSSRLLIAHTLAIDFLTKHGDAASLEEAVDDLSDDEVATLYLSVEEHLRSPTVSGFRGLLLWSRLTHRHWTNVSLNEPGLVVSAHLDSVLAMCIHLLRQTVRVHEPTDSIAERVSDLASDFIRRAARLGCSQPIQQRFLSAVRQVAIESNLAHPIVVNIRRRVLYGLSARLVEHDGSPARTDEAWAEAVLQGLQTANLTDPTFLKGSWALTGPTDFDKDADPDATWGRCRVAALAVFSISPLSPKRAQCILRGVLRSALRWKSHRGLQSEALKTCIYAIDAGHAEFINSDARELATTANENFGNDPDIRLKALKILYDSKSLVFSEQRQSAALAHRLAVIFSDNSELQIEASRRLLQLASAASIDSVHHALNAAILIERIAAANSEILFIRINACDCWGYVASLAKDKFPGLVRRAFKAITALASGMEYCYRIQLAKANTMACLAWCDRVSDPQETLSNATALYEIATRFPKCASFQLAQARVWRFVAFAFRISNISQVEDAARRVARIARAYPDEISIQLQSAQAWRSLVWALADIDVDGTIRVAHHVEQIARLNISDGLIQTICAETWRLVAYSAQRIGNVAIARHAAARIDQIMNESMAENDYAHITSESKLAWWLVAAAEEVASGRPYRAVPFKVMSDYFGAQQTTMTFSQSIMH